MEDHDNQGPLGMYVVPRLQLGLDIHFTSVRVQSISKSVHLERTKQMKFDVLLIALQACYSGHASCCAGSSTSRPCSSQCTRWLRTGLKGKRGQRNG